MSQPTPINRRQLVAAATATPALFAGPLLGTPFLPRDQVRLGVIGMGIRGRNLLNGAFLAQDGFRVVAVCDVDTNRREDGKRRVDERYGDRDCAMFLDHRELLQMPGLDAVVIATPDHWHANQIVDAAVAGKDIYCEKPLTNSLREAQVVIEVVRKHGIVFQTGSQQRTEYGQLFVDACEHVRNGHIGRVLTINVGVGDPSRACDLETEKPEPGLDWDRWQGPVPERGYNSVLSPRGVHNHYPQWRSYQEYAGGGVADMGAHHIDIGHWGIKRDGSGPVLVLPPTDPGALRGASVVYDDGTRLIHGGPNGTTFIGDGGMLHVDRGRISSVPDDILKREFGKDDERLPRPANHAANWLECIHSRAKPICDVEVGAGSAAVCHLLNLAYRHRRELHWNPKTWRFVNSDGTGDNLLQNAWLDGERREGYALPQI